MRIKLDELSIKELVFLRQHQFLHILFAYNRGTPIPESPPTVAQISRELERRRKLA